MTETEVPLAHEQISRLEERIETLAMKLESCRKFSLAARAAVALGALMLAGGLTGVVNLDPVTMTAAAAVVLGGIVMAGSNRSTTRETEAELREAEVERSALIGQADLRLVGGDKTLH